MSGETLYVQKLHEGLTVGMSKENFKDNELWPANWNVLFIQNSNMARREN